MDFEIKSEGIVVEFEGLRIQQTVIDETPNGLFWVKLNVINETTDEFVLYCESVGGRGSSLSTNY